MSSKFGPTIWDLGKAEGEVKGIRETLLLLGRKRFGDPDDASEAALVAIGDVERLKRLSGHLLDAGSWQELLQIP